MLHTVAAVLKKFSVVTAWLYADDSDGRALFTQIEQIIGSIIINTVRKTGVKMCKANFHSVVDADKQGYKNVI